MDRSNTKKKIYIYIYINAQQQMPVPYGGMLHIPPTSLLLLAAKQEPYKQTKKPISKLKILKNFLEKVQENGSARRWKKKKKRQKE